MTVAKKILFCATVDYHFKAFHLPYMKWFKEQGWDVHVAAAGKLELPYTDQKFSIPIARSPFHFTNVKAYNELKEIIDKQQYDLIHCHTPLGGVLARLAARQVRKKGTKVLYTAHGFHFCKGAPLMNWLIYYPIESYLSHFTDELITINSEDYKLANSHRFRAKNIEHVHGVGIDYERFKPVTDQAKKDKREEWGYHSNDFLMFYAAEFNKNKNQQLLIRALAMVKDELPQARLLLAGEGSFRHECEELARSLNVINQVDFLGFRKDIDQLLPICDVAVASSLREGLPVNIMEAMACGLPVVASENRGHSELVLNNKNGWVINPNNPVAFSEKLSVLAKDRELLKTLGTNGRSIIKNKYSIKNIMDELGRIYRKNMNEQEGVEWAIQ
ncbi:glycosyltransferase family 4 protein [Alkalihalobacillus sp. MEB130]|uniref:glycosyltransferase family 4 protein n=1 Tax=Alkalihalobacillus sp. MEB130 TaxID=2976704 RepID=UPI0028E04F70|nr:glycosyltransferase family 4 protein [Alkalihalobacillus sp. MEB130]MDT8861108.1 glycosyltransferase family 4 protein [Alkalihalobacillus sp. MEB130]